MLLAFVGGLLLWLFCWLPFKVVVVEVVVVLLVVDIVVVVVVIGRVVEEEREFVEIVVNGKISEISLLLSFLLAATFCECCICCCC